MNQANKMLRSLPAVETILKTETIQETLAQFPRWLVLDAIHDTLNRCRQEILAGHVLSEKEISHEVLFPKISMTLDNLLNFHLHPVINATGVVIHTNLGRSLLSQETMAHVSEISSRYSNLEYNLEQGRRGSRYSHVEEILCRLCDSESALVVNNNAGAVLLALNTLAEGKEVIVSRGQLVEIGGSFRIPDVIKKSGCRLVEVGTTNKTHPKDYQNAISPETACLLKVHMSNFEMRGFIREVSGKELVEIARESNLPLMEDLGSGSLIDLSSYGMKKEPTARESLEQGIDLVTFSGDKLLGGPQAGILVGKKELMDRVKKNPLTRALRVDKMTLSALEVTLRELMDPEKALQTIPTLRMLTFSKEELKSRAEKLSKLIKDKTGNKLSVEVMEDLSQVGGGALPENLLPTYVVSLTSSEMTVNQLEKALRTGHPPVIGRIKKDQLFLDVRTIQEEELAAIGLAAGKVVG